MRQFVIEGTVGAGSKGDVALDDLMVLDGICEIILRQGKSTKMYPHSFLLQ